MTHPGVALQQAVFSALTNSAELEAAFGAPPRVYDRVPPNVILPYVTIGELQIVDDTHCEAAWEAFTTTHVWSEAPGKPEASRIADALGSALDSELAIAGFRVVHWEHRDTRTFTEPDGLTTHGVIGHRYLIDQA